MNVALVWHCKTPRGWRRFPVIIEKEHGRDVVRHGWVKDKVTGKEEHYPQGDYQLRSFRDGKQHFEKVPTCHPRDVILFWERARRIAKPARGQPANVALLKNAADAYVKNRRDARKMEAAEHARLVLDDFIKVCTTPYVRSVTTKCVEDFHAALRGRGLSERTIANKHERLRSFFKFLKLDTSWFPDAPDYEEALPDMYSEAQLDAIRAAADPYMRVVIDMAYMLALREQELMFAEWSDVNWDHSTFRVQAKPAYGFMPKDKEQRDLSIPAVLLNRLKAHREKQPEGTRLVLATGKNTPNTHLLRTLKRLAKSAGLNCGHCDGCKPRTRKVGKYQDEVKVGEECYEWTLHRFRRTCLTTMLRGGVDARTVQHFAGHSSLETTLRYISPASTSEMRDKMNAIFGD
jgi:integrase